MEIAELISPDRVIAGLRVPDKAALLRELSRRAAAALGIDASGILAALLAREELGSTGVGQGIALPHARMAGLPGLFGLFARLDRAIDFAAIDGQPVDLAFLLLIPAEAGAEHLAALAAVSRRLREKEIARRLRATKDADLLLQVLIAGAGANSLSLAAPAKRNGAK